MRMDPESPFRKPGRWATRASSLVASLLMSCLAVAYGQQTLDIRQLPDEPWRKSQCKLGAMLLLTSEPSEFLASWRNPKEGATIESVRSVARGAPVLAFIAFLGCRSDDGGLCNITTDTTILKPDGSVYGQHMAKELWQHDAPPEGVSQLGASYVRVTIEPEDPLGTYVVKVTVHDLNADVSLDLRQVFEATEAAPEGEEEESD